MPSVVRIMTGVVVSAMGNRPRTPATVKEASIPGLPLAITSISSPGRTERAFRGRTHSISSGRTGGPGYRFANPNPPRCGQPFAVDQEHRLDLKVAGRQRDHRQEPAVGMVDIDLASVDQEPPGRIRVPQHKGSIDGRDGNPFVGMGDAQVLRDVEGLRGFAARLRYWCRIG